MTTISKGVGSMADGDGRIVVGRRYTALAQAFHWSTAALMFAALALAWVMVNMPRTAPDRELLYTLHKSIGVTILALAIWRTAWRLRHPPPPSSSLAGRLERYLAEAAHIALYVILFGMPVTGYVISSAGGNAVSYFGLFDLPALPRNETAQHLAVWAHVAIGQWLVYALLLLHIAAVVFHVAVRRDRVLDRMLPAPVSPE